MQLEGSRLLPTGSRLSPLEAAHAEHDLIGIHVTVQALLGKGALLSPRC